MYDTTRPESMPPLRNAPSGTSLSSRSCTALPQRLVDVGEQLVRRAGASVSNSVTSQYSRDLDAAVGDAQPVAGQELVDVAIDRGRREEVAERQIAFERGQIDLAVPQRRSRRAPAARWRSERRRRGPCRRTASCRADRARRTARAAGRRRSRTRTCPRADRRRPGRTPRRREGSSRCRTRAETMPLGFEQRAQIAVVVDLAVEDDPAGAVFVRHRLMAAGAIDDREPAMAERRRGPSSKKPSPSGPRWAIAAFIAGTAAATSRPSGPSSRKRRRCRTYQA